MKRKINNVNGSSEVHTVSDPPNGEQYPACTSKFSFAAHIFVEAEFGRVATHWGIKTSSSFHSFTAPFLSTCYLGWSQRCDDVSFIFLELTHLLPSTGLFVNTSFSPWFSRIFQWPGKSKCVSAAALSYVCNQHQNTELLRKEDQLTHCSYL